jgi:hypothetical protein
MRDRAESPDRFLWTVRVLEHDGSPVVGALVVVEWSDVPVPEIALVTSERGEVAMRLLPGRYRLAAIAAGARAILETRIDGNETELPPIVFSLRK